MKVDCKLDYSWKDADSTHASCTVTLSGEGDKAEALKASDREIIHETSNKYISFIPRTVNGEVMDTDDFEEFFWTTAACLAFLKLHPEATEFKLDGGME